MAKALRSNTWRDAVWQGLHWYIESNSNQSRIETGIVLLQACLELLTWVTFVDDGPITKDGFHAVPASDRIRLLLMRGGVPLAIPKALTDLISLKKARKWSDGPHALTEVRNGIIHPNKRAAVTRDTARAYYDLWRLARWYVELSLLTVFDYSGPYANRVGGHSWTLSEPEMVPSRSHPPAIR